MIGHDVDWKVGDWVRCWCGWDGDPTGVGLDPELDCQQIGVVVKLDPDTKYGATVHWRHLHHDPTQWWENNSWGLEWCERMTPTEELTLEYISALTRGDVT